MKSKTILGADGATKMRQITVGIHGKGGEAGIKAIQQLAGMVDSLKQCQTPQEVYDRYLQITGYCKCCIDCDFMDEKGADELMCLAAYLAGKTAGSKVCKLVWTDRDYLQLYVFSD